MARDLLINGEVLVLVKGSPSSALGTAVRELGLCSDSIRLTPTFKHLDVPLDAWGGANGVAPEVQAMLAEFQITMDLIHFDVDTLKDCLSAALGSTQTTTHGVMARAGTRLGGGIDKDVAGGSGQVHHYVQLQLSSPVGGLPWYFPYTYLTGTPVEIPIGVERSIVRSTFRAIPYAGGAGGTTADPYNSQNFASGKVLWANTQTLALP